MLGTWIWTRSNQYCTEQSSTHNVCSQLCCTLHYTIFILMLPWKEGAWQVSQGKWQPLLHSPWVLVSLSTRINSAILTTRPLQNIVLGNPFNFYLFYIIMTVFSQQWYVYHSSSAPSSTACPASSLPTSKSTSQLPEEEQVRIPETYLIFLLLTKQK